MWKIHYLQLTSTIGKWREQTSYQAVPAHSGIMRLNQTMEDNRAFSTFTPMQRQGTYEKDLPLASEDDGSSWLPIGSVVFSGLIYLVLISKPWWICGICEWPGAWLVSHSKEPASFLSIHQSLEQWNKLGDSLKASGGRIQMNVIGHCSLSSLTVKVGDKEDLFYCLHCICIVPPSRAFLGTMEPFTAWPKGDGGTNSSFAPLSPHFDTSILQRELLAHHHLQASIQLNILRILLMFHLSSVY